MDVSGLTVLPGAVDVHVHFRDMDEAHKETWATGSRAAAAGGVTCVVDQPNTSPPTVDEASLARKREAAESSLVDYCVNGAASPDSRMEDLAPEVAAFGETFMPELSREELRGVLDRAGVLGVLSTIHAEDPGPVERGLAGAKGGPPGSYADARPPEAEKRGAETALELAEDAGADIHFCHVSTPEAADAATNAGYTAEATPHHLLLDREELERRGALAKCNPPLRDPSTREGLWERFLDGDLVVATDHAPHVEKGGDFWDAPPGVPGVQTSVPVLLGLALDGDVPLSRVVEACCSRPAEVLGLPKGRIAPGMDADLVLYDFDAVEEVDPARLHSRAGYSLFEGWDAVFPVETMVRGETVHRGGEFGEPSGKLYRGEELRNS